MSMSAAGKLRGRTAPVQVPPVVDSRCGAGRDGPRAGRRRLPARPAPQIGGRLIWRGGAPIIPRYEPSPGPNDVDAIGVGVPPDGLAPGGPRYPGSALTSVRPDGGFLVFRAKPNGPAPEQVVEPP